jgi:O-antigen/teichoic acid export membrane protein
LTQFGSALFAFACVWLISKKIGSEGYGGVVAIIAASQVAQILVNWTSYSVVRFGTEEFIETEKIARAFWLRFFVLVPNILFALLASKLWFPPLAGWLKLPAESFWFVILHFAATAVWIHVQFGLQGAKLPREQGFLLMFERFLTLAGILILLGIDKLSPLSALICYSISPILMMSVGVFYLRRFIFARFSVDLPYLKKILAYSLPLLPFSLVGYFSGSYVDAIFVSNFLSTKDLGIYSVATQINGIALQLPTLANSLLLPLFITLQKESNNERTKNYFLNIMPSLTLIWGIGCAFLAFIGYFAVPLVFGAEFSEATLPLWVLLSSSVVAIPVAIGYSALSNATSRTYISMFAAIFSAILNIAANFLLIPKYGVAGCAWATLISYAVSSLTFAFLLRRSAKMALSWTFLAIVPSVFGVMSFTYNQNAWQALTICLAASFLVAYLFRNSIKSAVSFLKAIIKTDYR